MASDVTEHDHCRFCGDAVPSDQAYCSVECYYKDQDKIKGEKRKEILWTAIAFVGVLAILAVGFLF